MTNQITDPPGTYDAGESFNYGSWPANTTLTLTNVNWNNDYRDVVRFSSQGALDSWIDSQLGNLTINRATNKKFQQMKLRINTPINPAMAYNYLRASNPLNPVQGDTQRNYYYFITDIAYISGNTTELTLQLDVWQTFIYQTTLGLCYVERGHIGIANTNAFDNYGRDYLDIPEGLDVGGEYQIVKTATDTVMSTDGSVPYSILLCSTVDLRVPPGTVTAPVLRTSQASIVDGIVSGASFYVLPSVSDFIAFMAVYADKPWVTQGIISVTVIPDVNRYYPGASLTDYAPTISAAAGGTSTPAWHMYGYPNGHSQGKTVSLATAWRDALTALLPTAYRGLKKFLTYPYSLVELTTWAAQPLVIRPEAWNDPDATIREIAVMMPPGQRIAFMPVRYNAASSTSDGGDADDGAESLDFATTMSGFPSVPIVNNMAIAYLAANKNGLAFQRQSADWSQNRALMGATATENIANAEIANTTDQATIANNATAGRALLGAATGMATGITSGIAATGAGAAMGGAGGFAGIADIANAGFNANAQMAGAAIEQGARRQSAVSSNLATGTIRDTNVSLARRAAKGDYQNTILGINAKVQDAMLTQPSIAGQFGGDALNLAHGLAGASVRFKMVDPATIRRVGNFWLRYGYAVQQFVTVPNDLQCMNKFTYWKMQEAYIVATTVPEGFKQTIRGILEKGVTVWGSPSYIGVTSLSDNTAKTGISY